MLGSVYINSENFNGIYFSTSPMSVFACKCLNQLKIPIKVLVFKANRCLFKCPPWKGFNLEAIQLK